MANDYYKYEPSMAAAIIIVVCFSLPGLFHTWQVARLRSWYFIPFIVGCAGMIPLSKACLGLKGVADEIKQLRPSDMQAELSMQNKTPGSGLKGHTSSKPFYSSLVPHFSPLPSTWFSDDLSDFSKPIDTRLSG
jgi:hypothetical protein